MRGFGRLLGGFWEGLERLLGGIWEVWETWKLIGLILASLGFSWVSLGRCLAFWDGFWANPAIEASAASDRMGQLEEGDLTLEILRKGRKLVFSMQVRG